jgi:hypothetical protein
MSACRILALCAALAVASAGAHAQRAMLCLYSLAWLVAATVSLTVTIM